MRRFASETSRISFLLIVVLTLANPAAADQIVLKNGDRLTGKIVKSDGKTLVLKSDLVGEVAICRTHRAAPNKTIYADHRIEGEAGSTQMIYLFLTLRFFKLETWSADAIRWPNPVARREKSPCAKPRLPLLPLH